MSDEKPKPGMRTEVSVSHKNSTDFVNSGSMFDQRLVSAYFTSNLSTSMVNVKFSQDANQLSLSSGLLTNWQKGEPYQTSATRERSLNVASGAVTVPLSNDYSLNVKGLGVYVPSDGKGPVVSFVNPEAKIIHDQHYVGLGGIAGQNVTNNQFYALGGYKGTQVNAGVYALPASGAGLRLMASQDCKINADSKVQLLGSYETGASGEKRLGAIYQATFAAVTVRADALFNTQTAHSIENLNARAEFPFALNKKSQHALHGVISVFAGAAGEFQTAANPNPSLNAVYGAGVNFKLFDSKNHIAR